MQTEFTKCWTCPPALPGKRVLLLPRCSTMLRARVPLSRLCAEPHCGRRVRIWRASSSCWNAGAGGADETLRGLSAFPARQHLPLSCLRPGGTRVPLGECLPRRPAPAPTFPPVASHLCLRPAGLRPLVRTTPQAVRRDHRVHTGRLCSFSTRARSQAHTASRESSPGHSALLLSLPYWAGASCRPGAFPTPLYSTIPARLWS